MRYLTSDRSARRPRNARRVRTYSTWPIPRPRVPVDLVPMAILNFVLEGAARLAVTR